MRVMNREQAWCEVGRLIPDDCVKDYEASGRAGYPIYRSTTEYYNYICDLGSRLEVNLANGQTVNIEIRKPDTIEEYAECEASTITIRSYYNGSSKDIIRNTTEEEKRILKAVILGTLNAINAGKEKQCAMDVAEHIAIHLFLETQEGRCNTYDSVYCKIRCCPDYLLNP